MNHIVQEGESYLYNRLDEVKRQHEGQKKIDFFGPTLHPRDIDWLIEQAEKAQLLEYQIKRFEYLTS